MGARRDSLLWIARLTALVLSCGIFAVSVWYVWTAVMMPMELEIREGSGWILVLAKRAGVDIYDTSRVAFVNMNHGPMDPVLKGWIGTLFPRLEGQTVIRIFVFLMPFFFLGSAYHVCRRNWTEALFAAGALHLLLADVTTTLLVGRSDATLLCGTAVGFALTHALLVTHHRNWTSRRYLVLQVLFGSCGAVMFLTNWRVFPTIGVMVLLTFAKQVAESGYRFWRVAFGALLFYTVGFALVWLPMFLFELHGSFDLYTKRFFGFFTRASGWGSVPGPEFRLFPSEIYEPRVGLLVLMGGLVLAALYRLRRERAQLIVWLLMLPAGWVVHSYAYYANQRGGGLHYYFTFLIMAWFLVLHGLRRGGRWRPLAHVAVAGLFLLLYPWQPLMARGRQIRELAGQSRTFLREVTARTKGLPVFGENPHLYKHEYRGEVVDSGDTADAISRSGYYGANLTRTYQRYVDELTAHPPEFVLSSWLDPKIVSATGSPRLYQLLQERYRLALAGPQTFVANGGGGTSLYELIR